VLDPAGLRHDLLVLELPGGQSFSGLIKDDGSCAGGSLVNRDDKLFHGFFGSNFLEIGSAR